MGNAAHQKADLFLRRRGDVSHLARALAAAEDQHAVAQAHQFFQVCRDEQDGRAFFLFFQQGASHKVDRTDIQPSRGLGGDQELRPPADLARKHDLLQVAARHAADGVVVRYAADIKVFLELFAVLLDTFALQHAAARKPRRALTAADQVFAEFGAQAEARVHAVFGNIAHALVPARFNVCLCDILAAEGDRAMACTVHADEQIDKLRLPVALHAADAEDLARVHLHRKILEARDAQIVKVPQVLGLADALADLACAVVFDELRVLAVDHRAGDVIFLHTARHLRHDLSCADDGDAVADLHDLAQLVRDEDDALSLALELFDDAEEFRCLLRGEHGRRLVEDEHPCTEVECLDDLHLLPLAHAQPPDGHIGRNLQPEAAQHFLHLAACFLVADKTEAGRSGGHDDVLQNGHLLDLHEVLMHHADAELHRTGHVVRDGLAIDLDGAAVRLVLAVENAHQSRFTGAVFADERMRLAGIKLEID